MEPATRVLMVDGLRVPYEERGSGEPIVLLHGYPQSQRAWRHQLEPLSRAHRAIAITLPGWGDAERRLDAVGGYEGDVARLGRILDALGIERCNLFAHDYGGHLALGFALEQPRRVLRLAILASRAQRTFPPLLALLTGAVVALASVPILRWLLYLAPIAAIHRLGMGRELRIGAFDAPLVEHYVGWMGTWAGKRWWARFFARYRVRERASLREGLPRIAGPSAVVWGDADPWCPMWIAEELMARLPHAELTRLPGVGHFVMEEAPAEVTAALARLLARPLPQGEGSPHDLPRTLLGGVE